MLLAAAYQQLGKTDEARAAMEKGRELRPGSTDAQRPDAQEEFQPDLYRGDRTDHAVDGRGGLAGGLTLRPLDYSVTWTGNVPP